MTRPLANRVKVGIKVTPNALAVHPMEGADGTRAGGPSEHTFRRYKRFAAGGAGLIWTEAVAVVDEGRANPRQLFLHADTKDDFKRLVEETKETALKECSHEPLLIAQLTHSGRYSKPQGTPRPMIAYHNSYLDKASRLDEVDYVLVDDDYLDSLIPVFREAASCKRFILFVDIKSRHGYPSSSRGASYRQIRYHI